MEGTAANPVAVLEELVGLLRELALSGTIDADPDGRQVMGLVYELGLLLHRHSEAFDEARFRELLEESAELMPVALTPIEAYVGDTERKFSSAWELDEWIWVCNRRSATEFLFELYRDTPFAEHLSRVDASRIDELLRERGHDEGWLPPEKIPEGIPPSHWWWWYPADPEPRPHG
jgi:hypothetical protein